MALAYYKLITVDRTQCGVANSSNYIIAIVVTDANLRTTGNGGYVESAVGDDIRPYDSAHAVAITTYELVSYNATTGALEMHVMVSSLTVSTDTVFTLMYGDASIVTDGSSTTTWNANMKGVWHLAKNGVQDLTDSTSQGNNGTNHSTSAAAAVLGSGASFTATTQYIDFGTNNPLGGATACTISCWLKYANLNTNRGIVSKWGGASSDAQFLLMEDDLTNSELSFYVEGGGLYAGTRTTNASLTTATWYLIHATWAATNTFVVYVNGVAKSLSGILNQGTTALASPGSNVYLGEEVAETRSALDGLLDEARCMNAAVSASWATADYNIQKPSSTALSFGSHTAVGGGAVYTPFHYLRHVAAAA